MARIHTHTQTQSTRIPDAHTQRRPSQGGKNTAKNYGRQDDIKV